MKTSLARLAWEWTRTIVSSFAIFLAIRAFIIQTFVITSGSMEGTLLVGDLLVLNRVAYGASVPGTNVKLPGYTAPMRGDVVVFRGQHEDLDIIKRIIGLPGDTLEMRKGVLYINGREQHEPYATHSDPNGDGMHPWMQWQADYLLASVDKTKYKPTRDNWGPLAVPVNRFFMMGDNRDESLDSRFWGFLDPARVKGKASVIYYSYERDQMQPFPWLHGRWDRIGNGIH